MEQINPPSVNVYNLAKIFKAYKDSDGLTMYNLYNTINIEGDIDPVLYTEAFITEEDNWYSLSYKYYNTTYLWWTFLIVNKIDNPFQIGYPLKLKILKPSVVSRILNEISIS